ncbi:TatD family hydrolase [Oceanobacillus manasiensis]|uniref:TatD family hydrolase n=1 Tax=Oceanobacillus manasiensis TaxID=586413 RepID=UPI0005A89FD2|nr:TatD family hydrolase [Oceanobacillus manasiensis]
MRAVIDAHIHLDMYTQEQQTRILQGLDDANVEALVCVSNHLRSAGKLLELSKKDGRVKPAIGYHPEQVLPTEEEQSALCELLDQESSHFVAIGEVGLPYYMRKENPDISLNAYIELLEKFIRKAAQLDKPIVLHAVYEDAPIVCDLLEKHNVKKAHFHWFKGDKQTVERMIRNGYYISITPDCLYETEIQQLIQNYPLEQMMIETDGPWPFEGEFHGQLTCPNMLHRIAEKIAFLKKFDLGKVYRQLYNNTKEFYNLTD